ncbi:MAG: hypothetical protein HGA36_00535 [Candidatus Moranbacteria bacterium]|nr:hypothetical protein [Candidatus Moranbacteria bacterium]
MTIFIVQVQIHGQKEKLKNISILNAKTVIQKSTAGVRKQQLTTRLAAKNIAFHAYQNKTTNKRQRIQQKPAPLKRSRLLNF